MPTAEILVFKQTVHQDNSPDYVMSDSSVDRYGDVVEAEGWDLRNFKRHPIALFNHDIDKPIGLWENVRVERGALRGRLKLAPPGSSQRLAEMHALYDAGVLKATSVGFRKLEAEPIGQRGVRFKKHELLECSLVTVPANPNALQVAKSLNISDDTMRLVFGVPANEPDRVTRGTTGVPAVPPPVRKPGTMEPIAKKIEAAQQKLDDLKNQLTAHLDQAGDEPDDVAQTVTEELNGKIASTQRNLENLTEAERQIGSRAVQVAHERKALDGDVLPPMRRPFAAPAEKELTPSERVLRTIVGMVVAGARRQHEPTVTALQCMAERYGSDGKVDEKSAITASVLTRSEGMLRNPFDMVLRAATAPATTTNATWALPLVSTLQAGFMDLLAPASIFPRLAANAMRLSFGRNGTINIPLRSATPTVAGAFVLEGGAIPVKQAGYTTKSFTPKKMGVISTFTREISEHSTPDIEMLVRDHMQVDTAAILDGILVSTAAADTKTPPGLRNGVAGLTATAGGGFTALLGDLKALLGALQTSVNGNLRRVVWLMNPNQALSIALTQNAGGDFPFAAQINAGQLQGSPVIVSGTVPDKVVIVMDAADFAVIEGNAPLFAVSDQATLHMEDTTPLDIATGPQGTGVIATPTKSMFQTDSIALRMVFDVNWGFIRVPSTVQWVSAVTW